MVSTEKSPEECFRELEGDLSLQDEIAAPVLEAMKQAGPLVASRVRRCMRISEKIDRKAVKLLGDEHLSHLLAVDETLKHIGLSTLPPTNLTPAMVAHLEELFLLTQPNFKLDDKQKQIVREYCAKHNPASEEN